MKLSENGLSIVRWLKKLWEGLVEPAWIGDARERYLSRILNIILLIFLLLGLGVEFFSRLNHKLPSSGEPLTLLIICLLALAYYLNGQGQFSAAIMLTLSLFIVSTFASILLQNVRGNADLSALYYLLMAVLISDLFFSLRGFLVTVAVILGGVFAISMINPDAAPIFIFLCIFCALIGFSSYNRRSMQAQQFSLISQFAHEKSLLSIQQQRFAQLSLLEAAGRQINDSLNEKEILENTLQALVNKFGYARASMSLQIEGDILEVSAVAGTRNINYWRQSRHHLSDGVIGHVAETHQAYLAADVSKDPYYISSAEQNGSAMAVPILDKQQLLGVIHVESAMKNDLQAEDVQTLQTLANQVATSLQKARLYARTQEHLQVMTALQSVSHTATASLELNEILDNVIRLLRHSFGYTYISVYLLNGDILSLGAQLGYPEDMLIRNIPITSGVIGRTARTKETQFLRDASADPDFIRGAYEVQSEIAVPLLKEDNVLGVLNVEAMENGSLDENDVSFLNALAGSIAVAIDNARLHAEVKRMAMTDVVSGLANRRAFDDFLNAEITRASRYNQPISLIILDLDSFKEYNDRWGHPAGDLRLKEIADLLRLNVREPDLAARYGGEEFAVILPNTPKRGALRLAERLRRSAEACAPYPNGRHGPVAGYTISLGVATYPDDATTVDELLLTADNAELMAKRLGKNRVQPANTSRSLQSSYDE
jgi:diguanylate cyclase (GGDEF)-like protein